MKRYALGAYIIGGWIMAILFLIPAAAFSETGDDYKKEKQYKKVLKFTATTQAALIRGDFGAPKNTTIGYFSESLKYGCKAGEIGLNIPYLIRNGGGITVNESVLAGGVAIPNHADGIGDISLRGRYYLLAEDGRWPSVDLVSRVKFPTASHSRGLGTGKFDFSGGTSFLKQFGKFVGLLDTELLARNRPKGSNLKPLRFDYSAGLGYPFTRKVSGYFFVDGSTKSSKSDRIPVELVLAGAYKPKKILSVNGYLLFGLTDASPDIGVSGGVTRYF